MNIVAPEQSSKLASEVRVWSKIAVGRLDECWSWTGCRDALGYGFVKVYGVGVRRAHRVVWEMVHGPLNKDGSYHGVCVCHRCDNPPCCNPAHLFIGSHADNMRDRDVKGRQVALKGERSGNAKISQAVADEIRARVLGGERGGAVARSLGVTKHCVSDIVRGRTWAQ